MDQKPNGPKEYWIAGMEHRNPLVRGLTILGTLGAGGLILLYALVGL